MGVAPTAPAAPPLRPPSLAPAGDDKPAVLIADDEAGMREGMRRVLAAHGYQAQAVDSGAAALAVVAEQPVPLLLIDLRMPGIDGFEVINQVRTRRPETLSIVVSAFATIESAVQSTKMGAFDFVVKPFTPSELMRVVDRAAEQWRLAREAARLERERAAHLLELAAEKSRLRTILQAMGEGLLVVNIDGEVVLDNLAARRLLGRVGEVTPRAPVATLVPDARFNEQVRALLEGSTTDVVKLEIPLGGGKAPHVLAASLAPIRDENARRLGVVVLLSDISEAKEYERVKSLFVSMVAHEVKAPIGAVEGYLRLILEDSLGGGPERVREVLSRCLDRTGALLSLVQDLLEITRRNSGRCERRIESVDVRALTAELVQFHADAAARQRVDVVVELGEGLPHARVDRHDLERVLTNLLSNAVKYNREGGRVTVRGRRAGDALALEVEDTGIGMSEEERQRLGEEFFRAKNPHTRAITGTGLGLALVKKIVASYHGELTVTSAPGQGSTFRVLLPAVIDGA